MATHSLTDEARKAAAAAGHALPDGSYPIRDKTELAKAIHAFGRAKPHHKTPLRGLIKKRAKQLGATDILPPSWTA